MGYSLSDDDLKKAMKGRTKVVIYQDLHKYHSLKQLLRPYGSVCLLYETKPNYGHWVGVIDRGSSVEVFDSYGKYRVDGELKIIDPQFRQQSGQNFAYLSKLLYEDGRPIEYNDTPVQSQNPQIATCGRHVLTRILMKDMPVGQYTKLLKKGNPDKIVTEVSNWLLGNTT